MRKVALTFLSTLAVAIPLHAERGRDQSYFTYDDGGTIVRQAEDGRETEAHVNLPVYPGDEVITSRRGRAEIRLADGNVIALDRSTDVRFRSIRGTADEFERWFNRRSQRYTQDSSQYLESSLAYSDYDLRQYGSWSYVSGLGTWGWRPHVGVGWRPYYYGSWIYGPNNCLT